MTQIIPAILATTEEEYQKKIHQIEDSDLFQDSWVHIDFMDNKFVPNESISPSAIGNKPVNIKIEAHLMVEDPFNWVDDLVRVGVKRIVAHTEIHFKEIDRFLDVAQDLDIEVGLALNPETSVEELEPFANKVDLILVMAVHPGFQGQEFIPVVLKKVHQIKKMNPKLVVEIDGGVNEENVRQIIDAGVDNLVIGSALFEYDNLEEGLEKIWEKVHG